MIIPISPLDTHPHSLYMIIRSSKNYLLCIFIYKCIKGIKGMIQLLSQKCVNNFIISIIETARIYYSNDLLTSASKSHVY